MNPREQKIVSALAVFLTAAFPVAVGAVTFRAQPVFVGLIKGEPGALPVLTSLFFNHFTGMLVTLLVLGAVSTWIAIQALRQKENEGETKLATLLVAVAFSALVSVGYLTLFIFSTALPVYAKFMER
jgi:hypothetical protein